jgi:hypothetical protein
VVGEEPTPSALPKPVAQPSPAPGQNNPFPPVVITPGQPMPTPAATPRPVMSATPRPTPIPTPWARVTPLPQSIPQTSFDPDAERMLPPPVYNGKSLSMNQTRWRLAEAKRYMQSQPLLIGSVDAIGPVSTDIVRLAAYDFASAKTHYLTLSKTAFLSRDLEFPLTTSEGRSVRLRVIRANGVNTAVMITDQQGKSMLPLIVQYPVERGGRFAEMAYYSSVHPGLATAESVYAGKMYVRNVIEIARQKLQQKGKYISPQIADIAERLCIVEHTDHQRFRTEYNLTIYNEVFTLFALNEGNTYRYAVSSAGAGGLIQMIPATYAMVKSRHYNVGFIPDFVTGMRDHINAGQAMLLYMQDTWNDLAASEAVQNALAGGYATQVDLMAAGYNSNPAKLPGYIRRGGAGWRSLIPRETKIYLQIYASLERHIPMTPRTR